MKMTFLPIAIRISGKKLLIIGGGKTALQKMKTLRRFTKSITLVAPRVCAGIKQRDFTIKKKNYEPKDLSGYFLVYACTNNRALNARIRADAHKKGLLVNSTDDPANCDFISPAIFKKGLMTVAINSTGRKVNKSVAWRDKIRKFLEHDHSTK
ncbi:MAG: bifunctional precorrin-2 dehydrogenase/sirohydrochlorin ferrochelatase [Elusimicrobia bacterium]|nr:bifunctional precorrin-2 dehydrogenase/sirohydrochlorin ferrochelatase [Elusimicrobiota bacterium]